MIQLVLTIISIPLFLRGLSYVQKYGMSVMRNIFANSVEEGYMTAAERILFLHLGVFPAMQTCSFNGKHLVELTRYYSANNDEPYAADNGCYAVGKKYDNRNRVIERDYYDEKLQLTNTMSGYSIVKYQYNTDTGTTTVFYYNKDGDPFVFESGYAAEKITYFEDGGEKIYLDASGEEITLSNGYSKEKWTINESGKEVERAFYSITGELVNNIWGYASVLREYNAQGLIMKKSYVNVQGDAVDSTEGYQSMVWEYDASGVLNRTSTYDVNGKMVWEQVQNDVS